MKIIVVDDSRSFRESIKDYLENMLGHKVIAEASDGEEFVRLDCLYDADIILMDIEMNKMDGIEATHVATIEFPYIKVLAVTMHIEHIFLWQLVAHGFKGCILKTDVFNTLKDALGKVASGNLYFPKNLDFKGI